MGAKIGEIEEMCAPLQEAAKQPDAAGTAAFRATWSKMADKLCGLAGEDEARGRLISAGAKYGRAASYYLTAERLQAHGAPDWLALYRRMLDVFNRGVRLAGENCERVEIRCGCRLARDARRRRSQAHRLRGRVARRLLLPSRRRL